MRSDLLILFTRPMWLDEWHIALVANRASLGQVISDLYRGSDFAPPLMHVTVWFLRHLTGGISPVMLRVLSFASVLLALAFVFLTLRRRFSISASVAGTLAVLGHSLVVLHMFEGRFYGPWLFLAAFFAWTLSLDGPAPSRRRDAAVAIASVLLCTIHWFGVISLGLMCLAAVATRGRNWRGGVRRVLPAVAGVAALVICVPLVVGQRSAIRGVSWMPDPDLPQALNLIRSYWIAGIPLAAALIVAIGLVRERSRGLLRESCAALRQDPSVAALAGLAVMPIVMTIVSLKQPVLLPRYSIVTFLAWAPLVAFAVQSLGRVMRGLVIAVLGVLVAGNVLRTEFNHMQFAAGIENGRRGLVQACRMRLPIIFQSRLTMYAVTETAPRCDAHFVALSGATLDRLFPGQLASGRNIFLIETEFAVLHERLYGFPKVAQQSRIDSLPRFLLVESDPQLASPYTERFLSAAFPDHTVTRLGPALLLAERK